MILQEIFFKSSWYLQKTYYILHRKISVIYYKNTCLITKIIRRYLQTTNERVI